MGLPPARLALGQLQAVQKCFDFGVSTPPYGAPGRCSSWIHVKYAWKYQLGLTGRVYEKKKDLRMI